MPHIFALPHICGGVIAVSFVEDLAGQLEQIPNAVVNERFLCGIVIHITASEMESHFVGMKQ